jgi:hypothetical protein
VDGIRQPKSVDVIGSGSDTVIVFIVELEVEALAKWQVRSELVSRFVPASGGAAVENLTLSVRGEREAVDSKGSLRA